MFDENMLKDNILLIIEVQLIIVIMKKQLYEINMSEIYM